jgi:hypothetical protein
MTITWDKNSYTLFLEGNTYWATLPYTDHLRKGQMFPIGIDITKEHAIERFFKVTYAHTYGGVGQIIN